MPPLLVEPGDLRSSGCKQDSRWLKGRFRSNILEVRQGQLAVFGHSWLVDRSVFHQFQRQSVPARYNSIPRRNCPDNGLAYQKCPNHARNKGSQSYLTVSESWIGLCSYRKLIRFCFHWISSSDGGQAFEKPWNLTETHVRSVHWLGASSASGTSRGQVGLT